MIDATEYALPSVDEDIGFHKIAKYNYFPGWHQQASAFELLINKDAWSKLSPAQKAIIETASRATIVYSMSLAEASQADVMIRNTENRGVTNITWWTEVLRILKNKWLEVAEEESRKDAFFRKVYEDYSEFRKNYAI